jgi:hypothetical protein
MRDLLKNINGETITNAFLDITKDIQIEEYVQEIITKEFFSLKRANRIKGKRLANFIKEQMPEIPNNNIKNLEFKIEGKPFHAVFAMNL